MVRAGLEPATSGFQVRRPNHSARLPPLQAASAVSSVDIGKHSSLRSWRDFGRESFCFGIEAVNESGEAVRGLVKSPVEKFVGFF